MSNRKNKKSLLTCFLLNSLILIMECIIFELLSVKNRNDAHKKADNRKNSGISYSSLIKSQSKVEKVEGVLTNSVHTQNGWSEGKGCI